VKVAAADNVFFDLSNFNFEIQQTSAVDEGLDVPTTIGRITLYENRPNPFNPSTAIGFDLPAASDRVTLRIYDTSGRLVRMLVDEALPAGSHTAEWNGLDVAGVGVPSGVYLYELRSGTQSMSRRMILLK
jgi:flagellar hook assembly protein FlgD